MDRTVPNGWILVFVAVSLVYYAQSCPDLPNFPRGQITYRGDVARYACTATGYRLNGARKLRCQDDGTWSPNIPTCRPRPICPEIEEGDHLIRKRINGRRRDGLWVFGSRHNFTCERGFLLSQSSIPAIECTRHGWNASIPSCIEPPRCPPLLDEIENGRSTAQNRTYAPMDIVRFICNEGYRTTSQSWRTCFMKKNSNGYISEWLGITPICEETMCPSLVGILENGNSIGSSRSVGANVTFRCSSGYELIGDSRLTCSLSGRWNGTIPVCDTGENYCPVLSIPVNGFKHDDRYNKNDHVEFSCASDYTLIGSSVRQCRGQGLWDGEPVKCIGNQDFDDLEELSIKFRGNLDSIQTNALYEAADDSNDSGQDNRGRLIPLTHNVGMELYFIFDSSNSVGKPNFKFAKDFAKSLVKEIGVTSRPNSLRVGAMVFNSKAEVAFHTVQFDTTDDVVAAINRIEYEGGGTNIALAFKTLQELMIPQSQQLNRDGSFKTVFLITDGEATEGGNSKEIADVVKAGGVTIHCIGISQDASRETLKNLASDPLNEHLFFLKSYPNLETLINLVTNQSLDYSECGKSNGVTVVEHPNMDTKADKGVWPWQVFFDITKETVTYVCGGTLIKPNWILTAAHCFHEITSFKAYAGILDRLNPRDELKLDVEQTFIHPDYDSATKRNDIALIRLRKPAKLGPSVRPVCLPNPEKEAKLLYRGGAVMTGWGHNGRVERNDESELRSVTLLQQITLPLRRREECIDSLEGETEKDWFDEGMTCAGYLNLEVGACKGDSGGPLVKNAKTENGRRWVVIGINSWGIGCSLPNELDFFTNVPHFMDWINEHIIPEVLPAD